MAHKKTAGSTRQHATRPGKRLGVKLFGGQKAKTGMILIRQKGSKWHAGKGVGMGRDFTIFAKQDGLVKFSRKLGRQFVSVVAA